MTANCRSHSLFGLLAADKSSAVPYSREIADQRRKYGESILRRADEQLAQQEQHEAAQEARLAGARQKRLDEKRKAAEAAEARAAELEAGARKLAEERRIARETVKQWAAELNEESEDEKQVHDDAVQIGWKYIISKCILCYTSYHRI